MISDHSDLIPVDLDSKLFQCIHQSTTFKFCHGIILLMYVCCSANISYWMSLSFSVFLYQYGTKSHGFSSVSMMNGLVKSGYCSTGAVVSLCSSNSNANWWFGFHSKGTSFINSWLSGAAIWEKFLTNRR